MTEINRSECSFCDLLSDYVLTVTDPAPEDMAVLDDNVAMPICYDCFEELKDHDLNSKQTAENGKDSAENVGGGRDE